MTAEAGGILDIPNFDGTDANWEKLVSEEVRSVCGLGRHGCTSGRRCRPDSFHQARSVS